MTGKKRYEIIDVTADTGIIAYGKDKESLFENAALGMSSLIVKPEKIQSKEKLEIKVESSNLDDLLIAWLNELLFIFETKEFIVKECRILEMDEKHLVAEIKGERFDAKSHPRQAHIKAATYHGLEINQHNSGWKAKVIFDV